MATQTPPAGKPQRSNKKACEFCKSRHLKCDGQHPCHACERRSLECIYNLFPSSSPHSTPTPTSAAFSENSSSPSSRNLPPYGAALDQSASPSSSGTGGNAFSSSSASALFAERPAKRPKLAGDSVPAAQMLHKLQEQPKMALPMPAPPKNAAKTTPLMPKAEPRGDYPMDYAMPSLALASTMPHPAPPSAMTPSATLPPISMQMYPPQHLLPSLQYHTPTHAAASFAAPQSQQQQHQQQQQQQQQHQRPLQALAVPPAGPVKNNPLALSNGLIVAYARAVSPFSSTNFTVRDAAELQRLLQTEKNRLSTIDTPTLVKAFVECTMVAHGSRYSNNFPLSQKYAEKAYDILRLIISRQKMTAEFVSQVQSITSGMELLIYFCIGSDDLMRARQIQTEAYRLLTLNKKHISTATAHRILGLQVGTCSDNEDANYYLEKANRMKLAADNQFEASGYVVLALMLAGRGLARSDSQLLPQRHSGPITDDMLNFYSFALDIVDKCEAAVAHFEKGQKPSQDLEHLLSVYRGVLSGARAVFFWQAGYDGDATAEAMKIISMGKSTPICKLPYLIAYGYALQVVRNCGLTQSLQRGLANLEIDAPMYPLVQRMVNQLREPVIKTETATTTTTTTSNSLPSGEISSFGGPVAVRIGASGSGAFSQVSSSVSSNNNNNNNTNNNAVLPACSMPGAAAPNTQSVPAQAVVTEQQQQQFQTQTTASTPSNTQSTTSSPISPATAEKGMADYFGSRPFEPYAATLIPETLGSISSTAPYLYNPASPAMTSFAPQPMLFPATLGDLEQQSPMFEQHQYWPATL